MEHPITESRRRGSLWCSHPGGQHSHRPGARTTTEALARASGSLRLHACALPGHVLAPALLWLCVSGAWAAEPATTTVSRSASTRPAAWRGIHLLFRGAEEMPLLERAIAESLAPMGVNVVVFEINYGYRFRSHPELCSVGALSRDDVQRLVSVCRRHGIRLIPQFNCLGHQSWSKSTLPLLAKYPELDETPQTPSDNRHIYCRSWCPLHPRVNEIVFALMDELIDAFEADAFHVGMDEVFLIASDQCPRCKGKDPARLFAGAVNDYHRRLVGERKLTMLMWGDRLIDGKVMKYGEWESSVNGTAPAIDFIPKDIIICDWHYEVRDDYPSVRYFQDKGFRVWPSSWHNPKAAEALMACAKRNATERMIGHLCTTWLPAGDVAAALLNEGDPATFHPKTAELAATIRKAFAR